MPKKKLLVIYGPTALGKTSLALKMAADLQGELISADSRQVYQGMDIGTGKDLEENQKVWLVDLIRPNQTFSSYQWARLAILAAKNIWSRNKLPIVVGGSAFYLKTLLEGLDTQGIAPNWPLRRKLEKLKLSDLKSRARKMDPKRWENLNNSDQNNPRRLIRLVELSLSRKKNDKNFFLKNANILGIYLDAPLEFIGEKIKKRIEKRMKQGIIKEIRYLLSLYCWEDPGLNCLAYKEFEDYFKKKKKLSLVKNEWFKDELSFAKKQKLWFRKNKLFIKVRADQKGSLDKAGQRMKKWSNG
ncbi:MAG: tRNA (adenosine(37)-N6)-dimethylallyltransferase MiaA [Candidatus Shapirobacteria bacterium]